MKSKELNIYNIPRDTVSLLTMSIKPRQLLAVVLWISVFVVVASTEYSIIGIVSGAISFFALVGMPDRKLLDIHENMVVVYDDRRPDMCYCIYWDELLSWQYIKRQSHDKLRFELIDGQIITCDIYRDRKLLVYLNIFAEGKEKKVNRRRGKAN